MNCTKRRAVLIEFARTGAADAGTRQHAAACRECAEFLEEQRALGAALAQVAEENAAALLPTEIEARIFREAANAIPARTRWRAAAAAALAASLAMGVYLARGPAQRPQPFVEIPYVAPLAPYERARVERMEVPVAALIAAGFEVHVPDISGVVQADVLVGQDGRPHAIRLIAEVNQ